MRALALLALLLLTACSGQPPVLPSPSPTPDADHLDITVLLDLSGPDAPLGAVQRDAMEAWLSRHTGGVAVRLTDVYVADDQAKLVPALKHAADKHASAGAGGSPHPPTHPLPPAARGRWAGLFADPAGRGLRDTVAEIDLTKIAGRRLRWPAPAGEDEQQGG